MSEITEKRRKWKNDPSLKRLGRRVGFLRKSLGLSQEKLAFKARADRSYLGAVERGEQNISYMTLRRIITALGTTPKDFFDFK
jgi:transcriptional regulator with XRE-family HTH domain